MSCRELGDLVQYLATNVASGSCSALQSVAAWTSFAKVTHRNILAAMLAFRFDGELLLNDTRDFEISRI